MAKGWWTGSVLDCHACCRELHRASRSSPVAVALGLLVSSTACRSWAERRTCSTVSRETSSPRSIQPASRFHRDSAAPLVWLAGCAPARRGRPVRPHASVTRVGAMDRLGCREEYPAPPPNILARPLPPRPHLALPSSWP